MLEAATQEEYKLLRLLKCALACIPNSEIIVTDEFAKIASWCEVKVERNNYTATTNITLVDKHKFLEITQKAIKPPEVIVTLEKDEV